MIALAGPLGCGEVQRQVIPMQGRRKSLVVGRNIDGVPGLGMRAGIHDVRRLASVNATLASRSSESAIASDGFQRPTTSVR
jgi:hypothetical protein